MIRDVRGAAAPEARLAQFVADWPDANIPDAALAAAHRQVFDTVGVAAAASAEPAGHAILDVLTAVGTSPVASILGLGRRAGVDQAAWANGSLAHLLDLDDAGFSHPSACILPAALAVAEQIDASADELLRAMVMGYESFERIAAVGRFDDRRIRQVGVHPTPIYGTIAAAAAAARLLRLSADETQRAMSLAAAEGSGLTQHFGSWAKGLAAGAAARSGVMAAFLARAGYNGDDEAISGRFGLFSAVHGPGRASFEGFDTDLGSRWAIVDPGLSIKLYPACGVNRRAVDAVLSIRSRTGFTAEDVAEIVVHAQPDVFNTLRFRAPEFGFRGKFSLDYTVASAAVDGDVTIDSFSDQAARRPALRAMLERIRIVEHPEWPIDRYRELPVEVHLQDGRRLKESPPTARGTRQSPLTDEDVRAKFRVCVSRAVGTDNAARADEAWWALRGDARVSAALLTVVRSS